MRGGRRSRARTGWVRGKIAAPILGTALACGGGDVGPGSATVTASVRDSAGIEIIEERLEPGMAIGIVEELRIGSVDGPEQEQFASAGDIERSAAGELIVADPEGAVIRAFAPDGTFLRQWGSAGEGPGEFEGGFQMHLVGDTVVVMDFSRIHTFLSSGEHVATVRSPRDRGVLPFALGATRSGWRLQVAYADRRPDATSWAFTELDPLTADIGRELFEIAIPHRSPVSGTNLVAQVPFEPITRGTFDALGRLYVTRAERYEIEVRSPDGATLERLIRPIWERRPITGEIMEGWAVYREDRMCGDQGSPPGFCEEYVDRVLPLELEASRPDFVPPAGSTHPGDVVSGGILVSRRDTDPNLFEDGDPRVFDLFGGDGRLRGQLTMPPTFLPGLLKGDELIGWIFDDFGVPYLVRYRLTFPAATRTGA